MKTLGSVILGTMEDLLDHKIIPEFKCRRCNVGYTFDVEDYCDLCIDEIINQEEEK